MNKKTSSAHIASQASKALTSGKTSSIQKQLAGSVLSQRNSSHQTGKHMESIASNVMRSEKYSSQTKSFAASVLSQSDKKR